MRAHLSLLGVCAGLALQLAAPARALENLSGTYAGKLRCTTTAGGITSKTRQEVSVEVLDEGLRGVTFEVVTLEDRIVGLVIEDALKAESGILPATSCDYEAFDQVGLVARLAVQTKAGTEQARLKGSLLRSNIDTATSSSCTLDVRRVSAEVPELEPCVHTAPAGR
jgi:hypothetical protein